MHPNEQRGSNTELVALRRKKNADAQAAFRKRRASYISSLETTVHGLEQVIRNLQESVQECKVNETNLKRDNERLNYELEGALRKLHGTPPRTADQAHGQQHWSTNGYRTAQPPYPPQMPASPSFTPPLSSANGSPSPPASSIMSSASAVPTPASPYIQTAAGSNGYITEEHPVNLLSRPLSMYRDAKGHPITVDGAVYSYQTRGQDASGWIDSPVQTAPGVHSFGYQQQGDSPQASHSGRQMPLSLNLAVDNSRTAYSSASASPTTTDSGSPYVTRGHAPGFAPAAPSAHGGLDAGAAFRSYFSQATGNGEPSTSSLTGVSHLRADPGPMGHMPPPLGPPSLSRSDVSPLVPPPMSRDGDFDDDILDDEDRPGGDDPIVSQTLAVLKSHAFGGSRKPRVRSIRGVQRHDSNGRSAMSPDRD